MTGFRAALFNLGFYLWTLVLGIVGLPLLLAPWRVIMRFGRFWSAATLRWLEWSVGLGHELRGAEHVPQGAAIVAMKHQSAWDTLVLPLLMPDAAVVIKRELAWIPLYGWYASRAGAIPIDRGAGATALRRIVARAREAARLGRPIVIFPEGTRTAVGERKPYQPGVAALYSQLALPLVPVAVNSGLYWGRRAFVKRPGRIVVEFLPPIAPGTDRRKALRECEERIEAATARLVAEAEDAAAPAVASRLARGG
jgi:1-acyl-sn-glycerol-3-phosphate acyltransferase